MRAAHPGPSGQAVSCTSTRFPSACAETSARAVLLARPLCVSRARLRSPILRGRCGVDRRPVARHVDAQPAVSASTVKSPIKSPDL